MLTLAYNEGALAPRKCYRQGYKKPPPCFPTVTSNHSFCFFIILTPCTFPPPLTTQTYAHTFHLLVVQDFI